MISNSSLQLFQKAAAEIPAYKAFLKEQSFDPSTVKNLEDFRLVPKISKKSYLQQYPRNDMIWPTALEGPLWYCSTSGSTGEPYYFPRVDELAARGAEFAEAFLRYSSYGQGRTLVLLGFGMGVWIGGVITLRSFEIAAERMQAPVSFLPTGYNKAEIYKALRKLSPEFDQTILVGYPPFIKEVVDEAEDEGIDLKKLHLRLMFAAEAFTETYRKYVCEKVGIANPLLDTLNIYGTADIGAMAYETPLSILVRKLALEDPGLYQDVFGQIEKTPTLAQYHPEFIEFEEIDGELYLTSDGAIPLIRYDIGDHGGVCTYADLEQILRRHGIELAAEAQKAGIGATIKKNPFVFVYERADLSASLHGILIYPEFIKEALLQPALSDEFTEKFTMSTKHDIHHNQFIQINLELKKGIELNDNLQQKAHKIICDALIAKSSEFAEVSKTKSCDSLVQIVLWPNGHKRYFTPGTKQKWVTKEAQPIGT